MKFLDYTKKLRNEVNKYDKLAQNPFVKRGMNNPFAKPREVKLIWIESCDKD